MPTQTRWTSIRRIDIFSPHVSISGVETGRAVGPSSHPLVDVRHKDLGNGRYVVDLIDAPQFDRRCQDELVIRLESTKEIKDREGSHIASEVVVSLVPSRRFRRRGWTRLMVSTGCRDSSTESGLNCFQILHEEEQRTSVVILRQPSTADWMRDVPDDTPLGDLCIPGTHESCAMYGYPISQCQQPSTKIEIQLLDGIRFLDVRLRVVGDQLLMYHGPRPQRSSLPILLDTLHAFLDRHPTETFILCLKEETPPVHPDFARLVYDSFAEYPQYWYLENRIPDLGEVRGRGILMTRFEATPGTWEQGLGVHPSTWPDSRPEGFSWLCGGTVVRTQDWYRVKTFLQIPEKFKAIVNHLSPTLEPNPGHAFSLSYTSASYFPLSLPTTIAKGFGWPDWGLGVYGVDQRLIFWLLRQIVEGKKVRACLPMDFYRECGDQRGLAEILVSMNYL